MNVAISNKHIGQIADQMDDEWNECIAERLELKPTDVKAIVTEYPRKLHSQTYAYLHKCCTKLIIDYILLKFSSI